MRSKYVRLITLFMCLGLFSLGGCAINELTATQQRNSHIVYANGYMKDIIKYQKLPVCTDILTIGCKDTVYMNETVVPARANFAATHNALNAAIKVDQVTSTIRSNETNAFKQLGVIATGDKIQKALKGE